MVFENEDPFTSLFELMIQNAIRWIISGIAENGAFLFAHQLPGSSAMLPSAEELGPRQADGVVQACSCSYPPQCNWSHPAPPMQPDRGLCPAV